MLVEGSLCCYHHYNMRACMNLYMDIRLCDKSTKPNLFRCMCRQIVVTGNVYTHTHTHTQAHTTSTTNLYLVLYTRRQIDDVVHVDGEPHVRIIYLICVVLCRCSTEFGKRILSVVYVIYQVCMCICIFMHRVWLKHVPCSEAAALKCGQWMLI
jgi:hypothetical protein